MLNNVMNKDLEDLKSFANIRHYAGHEEHFIYNMGAYYKLGKAPQTTLDFLCLTYVGGQSLN